MISVEVICKKRRKTKKFSYIALKIADGKKNKKFNGKHSQRVLIRMERRIWRTT
jgi:hypothetical protein